MRRLGRVSDNWLKRTGSIVSDTGSATSYFSTANEFFGAVHTLSLANHTAVAPPSLHMPTLIVLAFAFELLFKGEQLARNQNPKRTHNIPKLWSRCESDLAKEMPVWLEEYQERNGWNELHEAAAEDDPQFMLPVGQDFETNIRNLSRWTDNEAGFLARYPRLGTIRDVDVDIRFLHFVGIRMYRHLLRMYEQ